jgi:hypothetical protein
LKKQTKIKRLFFDIETSPNVVFSWNVGYKLNIDHGNILKEREIICICWKWEGDSKVNHLQWNKGDDKQMVLKFVDIIKQADEIIGHNGDNYDIKWFRTRCIFHGIEALPEFKSIDTLKISRTKFRFNSNRLDYVGKFLGFGGKMDTGGFKLWKSIILDNDKTSLDTMVKYCKRDVILLEKVYNKLSGYSTPKTNIAVLQGRTTCDCPHCGSDNTVSNGMKILASGTSKRKIQCNDCGKYYQVSNLVYLKSRNV